MPVVVACAVLEAIGVALVFALSPDYLKNSNSNTLVGLAFILFGFFFLFFATNVYCGSITKKEKWQLLLLGIFELVVFFLMLQIPLLIRFFNITLPYPSPIFIGKSLLVVLVFVCAQYFVVRKFFLNKRKI